LSCVRLVSKMQGTKARSCAHDRLLTTFSGRSWLRTGDSTQFSMLSEGHEHPDCRGDRKVEDLSLGDLLPTVFGGICPIQWIGRYSLKKSDPTKGWVKKMLPVRVARSVLGLDVPCADLYVTKEHALLIDGVLVTAGSLINGTTITVYDPRVLDELEFFHIKLERHNAIYAEGAPCETIINVEESAVNLPNIFVTMDIQQPKKRRARHCSAAMAVEAK